MKKLSVTYRAPKGDSKVMEAYGRTFYDGKAEEIEVEDHVAAKLQGNRLFECGEPSDVEPGKPDPEKQKQADEAAEREDERKREAQGVPPISRGAVLNKPGEAPQEQTDEQKRDAQKRPDATHGAGGGPPDPNQPQDRKKKIPGETEDGKQEAARDQAASFPQAGRDR